MRFTLFVSLLMLSLHSYSQEKILPVDEEGKYAFVQVKELKLVNKAVMAANVKRFFKENSKSLQLKNSENDTLFSGKGKMIIQKELVGIGHPSGDATYSVSVSLREGKYRLILTNFSLTPYVRDRFSNFVPGTVSTPLEQTPSKINRSEWESNMAAVMLGCKKVADKLELIIGNTVAEPKKDVKKPEVVSTTKW
ncbi:hypothetical protein ACVWYN_003044 [Pedobacter sp. UYP24]